ncbi:unnamed protein product [Effrenium voratum]|nr:unnamed protein product [Effrenium voratum]
MGEVKLSEMYNYAPIGTMVLREGRREGGHLVAEATQLATRVWYGAFFVSIVIITLNLLVAMVYDHYTIVKASRSAVIGWKLTCCCRKPERIPPQKDLLEADSPVWRRFVWDSALSFRFSRRQYFMERANLPNYERVAINNSVLGALAERGGRKMDAEGLPRDQFQSDSLLRSRKGKSQAAPGTPMELDADYAEALAQHCKEFANAGYDPEDARVSQLRQLVAAAEAGPRSRSGAVFGERLAIEAAETSQQDEIVEMRLRLQTCAEYSRQSMHGLTRLPRAAAAAGTYAARATAAAAAAARVAQRSPTARRPDTAAAPKLQRWRRENSALALATTSLGLEEILERELRSNGAVTAPLGSFWCFKAAPGQGLPHSEVIRLSALVMDDDLARLETKLATSASAFSTQIQALLQELGRGRKRKASYTVSCVLDARTDAVLGGSASFEAVTAGICQGISATTKWRLNEKRPEISIVALFGRDYFALGEVVQSRDRDEAERGAMASLACGALRGNALADPCCGQGLLLAECLKASKAAPSRVLGHDVRQAAVRGAARRSELAGAELAQDGGEWPLQRGEADVVISDLPNSGSDEEVTELYQRVVAEAGRVLRPEGRLILLSGRPELLAKAVVQGRWRTVGAWPLQRHGRYGEKRKVQEKLEQLVCLEQSQVSESKAIPKEEGMNKAKPKKSEEMKALWAKLGL